MEPIEVRINRTINSDLESLTRDWKEGLLTRGELVKELKCLAKIIKRASKSGY